MSKYFFAYDSNDKDIKLTCNYTLYPNKILRVTCLFFFFLGGEGIGMEIKLLIYGITRQQFYHCIRVSTTRVTFLSTWVVECVRSKKSLGYLVFFILLKNSSFFWAAKDWIRVGMIIGNLDWFNFGFKVIPSENK